MADETLNLLLKITAEPGQGEASLDELARRLRELDATTADAEADVDTTTADRKLRDLRQSLRDIGAEGVAAEVDVADRDARAKLVALNARLKAIDREHVDVEVDIDRDGAGRAALSGLGDRIKRLGPSFSGLAGDFRNAGSILVGLLVPGMLSLVGTFAPLVTAAVSGAGAVAAVGVAFAGAGVAAGLFAIGMKLALKRGGDSAQALKKAFTGLKNSLADAVTPGVQAFTGRLVPAMATVGKALASLRPAFTGFGQSAGRAAQTVANAIAGLDTKIGQLVGGAGPLFEVLARAVKPLLTIFLNIANAAMPLLIRGARRFVGALSGLADSTQDAGAVRRVLRAMARDFVQLVRLGKAVGGAVVAIFRALLPGGRQGLKDLTALVEEFTRWAESAKGQKQIRQFMQETFFAIRDLGNFIRTAGPGIALFFQTFGSLTTNLLQTTNALGQGIGGVVGALAGMAVFTRLLIRAAGPVGAVVAWFTIMSKIFGRLPAILLAVSGPLMPVVAAFLILRKLGIVTPILNALGAAFAFVGRALVTVGQFIAGLAAKFTGLGVRVAPLAFAVRGLVAAFRALIPLALNVARAIAGGLAPAVGLVTGVIGRVGKAIIGLLVGYAKLAFTAAQLIGRGIANGIRALTGPILAVARAILRAVVNAVRSYTGAAFNAAKTVFHGVRRGIAALLGAVVGAARTVLRTVVNVVRSYTGAALNAGKTVFHGVRRGVAALSGAIAGAARSVASRAVAVVRGFANNAAAAGRTIGHGVANGISALAGGIASAARGAISRALSIVRGLAGAFEAAGRALISALGRGIESAAGGIIDKAKSIANRVKSILPGSEPKDPTSPFRGLGKAGEAIVGNIAEGIRAAGPTLAVELAAQAAPLAAVPGVSVTERLERVVQQQPAGPAHLTVEFRSLFPPDARARREAARTVVEALGEQTKRPVKVVKQG